ncbi:MAG: hypothetical protein ACR2MQ_09900 [Gemmatimonadaceae bacterium]
MPIHAFALLVAAGIYTPSPAHHRTTLVDSTNQYRSPDEACALFAQASVPLNKTIVVYCHIGQTASVAYVQARRLDYR